MSHNRKGMNRHQKAVFRPGENRVRRGEITELLDLSQSNDPEDRLVAANNLCPCHVRKPVPAVQQAIFRMMEDPDVRVRRAAWHTIEDGGVPDDPALDEIYARRVASGEDDRQIQWIMEAFVAPRVKAKQQVAELRERQSRFTEHGKCDFCGAADVAVTRDYQTEIPVAGGALRLAFACKACYDQ